MKFVYEKKRRENEREREREGGREREREGETRKVNKYSPTSQVASQMSCA